MDNASKKIMVDILISFDKLCKKYDLNYWLDYGTLLGAVRHRGFIPWDDDIDVCMPRDDYMKFIEIAEEEFGEKLFLQTKKSDRYSPVHYAKLRDRNSTYIDKWEKDKNIRYHQGIFIDIYPVNYIEPRFKNYYRNILYVSKLFANRYIKIDFVAKIFIFILNKFHNKDASLVVLGAEGMVWDIECDKSDIFPLKRLDFEGFSFPVPNNYQKHLTKIYGENYMSLPPKNQRVSHSYKILVDQPCEYEKRKCK